MSPYLKELSQHKPVKITFRVIGLCVIFLLMVYARTLYGSMEAYKQGKSSMQNQQYLKAITFFDRTIHWYTPFNPYVQRAAELLWEIGIQAENRGDVKLALIAFRTIRSGFYAASHFTVPGRAWIMKCESKIEDLGKLEKNERGSESTPGRSARAPLKNQNSPPPGVVWTILLEIGFLGWVGSIIGFILIPLRAKERKKNWVFW